MTHPCNQHSQTWVVCLGHCREFQPKSPSGFYMSHNHLGPDLSFLHKKINLGHCLNRHDNRCLDKQASKTEVPYRGNVFSSVTPPINRHALDCIESIDT